MKGIVFCEFLELVESKFSMDMADDIIDDVKPPSGGSYTAVGTYEHTEMVNLVSALSARTGIDLKNLLSLFGEHLFGRFASLYPHFFVNMNDSFQFLIGIDSIIHTEVLKLYPDAQLPKFAIEFSSDTKLVMLYRSGRHFEDLAEGLMKGCFKHFNQNITIQRKNMLVNGIENERFELDRY
jgi:Haem-NO-binding